MSKKLRQYQVDAINCINADLNAGINRLMLVLATGLGKTFCSVRAVAPFKKRMFITHTEELLEQSGAAFLKEIAPNLDIQTMIDTHGGLTEYLRSVRSYGLFSDMSDNDIIRHVGIVKAEAFDIEADIVLASAQTLHRRLDRMHPEMFDAIVADEFHRYASKTFQLPLRHFNPKLLLGLTATPFRTDGASMLDICDKLTFQYNIGDGIGDGYLCEFDAIQVKTELSLDNVGTVGGDFNQRQLKNVVDVPARNKLLLEKYRTYANGKQSIVFCVDVEHAKNVHQIFIEAGESAEIVVGDEDITADRKGAINRFKTGQVRHLINCLILTDGFDHPGVGCIIDAAPTKSLTRFMQKAGRGTRTLPGVIDNLDTPEQRKAAIAASAKPNCILLDICDTTSKHKIVNTWSLDKDLPIEKRVFTTSAKKSQLIEVRKKREFEAKRDKDTRVALFPLPTVKYPTGDRVKLPATEKQMGWLQRNGFDMTASYTFEMANQIISNSDASAKQIAYLRALGYDVSAGVTLGAASLAFKEHEARVAKAQKAQQKKEMQTSNFPISDIT